MTVASKTEAVAVSGDSGRLAAALVGRGLVTADELGQCRGGPGGAQGLLERLQSKGFITSFQAARLAQELPQLVDQPIPGYQFLDKLGQGAMGVVYKARQLSMNRLVAIKVLHGRLANNKEFLERFLREARTAAKFSSNNIVQAIDAGSSGGLNYFVMEYVEGNTVRKELDAGKIFAEREALDVTLQVAQALDQAHRRGLIHRDVKPANIILTAEGVVKLADLGLARDLADRQAISAEKGVLVGTPYYIAPEQIEGLDDIDIRADIYSLGATLYHMVTGRPPFQNKNIDAILDAHLEEELTPPDHVNQKLSAGIGEVVEFMMAKKPKHRYRSPEELIIDLECLLKEEPPLLGRKKRKISRMVDEDEEELDGQQTVPIKWVAIGGGALMVSLFLNLLLAIKAIRF